MAVVQGNIPQKIKWDREYREQIISQYERLTEEATKSGPQLIIWPETATPGFVLNDLSLLQRIVTLASQGNAYLLVGSAEYPKFSRPNFKTQSKQGEYGLTFLSPGQGSRPVPKDALGAFWRIYPLQRHHPLARFHCPERKKELRYRRDRDPPSSGLTEIRSAPLSPGKSYFPTSPGIWLKRGRDSWST